jgi:hypothetical protein
MQNSGEERRENAESCLSIRHCEEPPGRANARPMTGSATKQSGVACVALDCFAYARNDGDANLSLTSCPAQAPRRRGIQ